MRAVSTTAGVGTVSECRALAKQWGFRPLALDSLSVITVPTESLEGDCLRVPEFPHRLIFVRHGETITTPKVGCKDSSIFRSTRAGATRRGAVGRAVNGQLGNEIERLEAAGAFFASPLERARETMEIARDAMGLKPGRYHLDAVLKELNFGVWEGLTWPEVEVKDPKGLRDRRKDRWGFAPKDGESYAMLADRLRPWLDTVSEHAFVISHGGVARVLMVLIAGVPPAKAVDTPILQGKAIVFENGGYAVDRVNIREEASAPTPAPALRESPRAAGCLALHRS